MSKIIDFKTSVLQTFLAAYDIQSYMGAYKNIYTQLGKTFK